MNAQSNRMGWRRVLIVGLFLIAALTIYVLITSGPTIDPAKPFEIEFGRGSGMAGLQTVRILENGEVILHRHQGVLDLHPDTVERTTLHLSKQQMMDLATMVSAHSIPSLSEKYIDYNIHDGTQWVLRLQQGGIIKATYFSNQFPRRVEAFARNFDDLLNSAGLGSATWSLVNSPRHDQRLWDSLRTR